MEAQHKESSLGLIGLILGIVALVLSGVPIINNLAFLLGVAALVLGIIAITKANKSKGVGRGKAIASTVLGALSLVIVIASQMFYAAVITTAGNELTKELNKTSQEATDSLDKMSGNKTEELLKNDVTVEIGTFSAEAGEYGMMTTELPVTVTNKNKEDKTYSIQIEAVDASGTRITEGTVLANNLGSGQKQVLKAFEYVESAKVDALKAATFKIVSISQY